MENAFPQERVYGPNSIKAMLPETTRNLTSALDKSKVTEMAQNLEYFQSPHESNELCDGAGRPCLGISQQLSNFLLGPNV